MRRLQMLVIAAVGAFGATAMADETPKTTKIQVKYDDPAAKANSDLDKAQRKAAKAVDKANAKATHAVHKARAKVPGVKKLQDATNNNSAK